MEGLCFLLQFVMQLVRQRRTYPICSSPKNKSIALISMTNNGLGAVSMEKVYVFLKSSILLCIISNLQPFWTLR